MIGSTNAPGILPSGGSLANWLSGTTYAVGDCVIYEDRIYQCKTANSDTTWTASKWTLLSDKLTAWVSGTSYKVGNTVIYDDRIYECLTANTDTVWAPAKWQKLSSDLLDWVASTSYAVGDCVIYNNAIYQCKTANSDATWTPANWQLISGSGIASWATSTEYEVGDKVIFNAQIYTCNTQHTSTAWATDVAKWDLIAGLQTWATNTTYKAGSLLYDDGILYKVNTTFTSGSTFEDTNLTAIMPKLSADTDNVLQIKSDGLFSSGGGGGLSPWVAGESYSVGDTVIYNNSIYQCLTANSDATFTPAKWQVLGAPLSVATDITLGGVKSTTVEGGIKVNSDGTMEYNKPADVVDPIASTAWAPNTEYKANNIVGYDGNAYICLENHTSSNDFDTDYLQGYWSKVDMPKVGASGYAQVLVMGVTGAASATPYVKSLAINPTNSFILPPVEVLEEAAAESTIINDLHFDNVDAADFNYDTRSVSFDGTMHLKTENDIPMTTPTVMGDGYISMSDEIDFDDYGTVEEVRLV